MGSEGPGAPRARHAVTDVTLPRTTPGARRTSAPGYLQRTDRSQPRPPAARIPYATDSLPFTPSAAQFPAAASAAATSQRTEENSKRLLPL